MLADDLRGLFLFDGVSDTQLGALAGTGEEVRFGTGDVLFQQGVRADHWWVLLEGKVELLRRAGREQTVVATMASPGQWAGGFKAWNDEAGYMASGRGAAPGRMFRVPGDELGRWTRAVFPLGAHLISGVLQTVRGIEAMANQRESLVALGTLAAGLAHEINNPAAATARAVDSLREVWETLLSSLGGLAAGQLSPDQFTELDALRRSLAREAGRDRAFVALQEDELVDWLEARQVEDGWRDAAVLAEAGADVAWCEHAAQVLPGRTLGPGLAWIASTLSAAAILDELKEATERISGLVTAVKSYTQLDRASVQFVDLTDGLESTLTMLRHKIGDSVAVERDYELRLPQVEANPAQLNQVWTNLIDNALDAMNGSGTLHLRVASEDAAVVVEVVDDGPGMTSEVQSHAFEPFFTTKDVGKGTGLGLDIARRIIEEHHGQVTIASHPGVTVVRVRLPLRGSPG